MSKGKNILITLLILSFYFSTSILAGRRALEYVNEDEDFYEERKNKEEERTPKYYIDEDGEKKYFSVDRGGINSRTSEIDLKEYDYDQVSVNGEEDDYYENRTHQNNQIKENKRQATLNLCINIANQAYKFAQETAKDSKPEWTNVILNRPTGENYNWGETSINCYSKKDAVIHIICNSKDHTKDRRPSFFKIKDPVLIDQFAGTSIYGLKSEEYFETYGNEILFHKLGYLAMCLQTTESTGIYLRIRFKDNKINEISGKVGIIKDGFIHFDPDNDYYINDFRAFIESNPPEGLLTNGITLEKTDMWKKIPETASSSIRKLEIPQGTPLYIKEFKQIDEKNRWVKAFTTYGKIGWINNEYVGPNKPCFCGHSRMNSTFDSLLDLRFVFGSPQDENEDIHDLGYKTIETIFDGIKIMELYLPLEKEETTNNHESKLELLEMKPKEYSTKAQKSFEFLKELEEPSQEQTSKKKNYKKIYGSTKHNYSEFFIELSITNALPDFASFRINDDVKSLKNLSQKLSECNWYKTDNNEIADNGIFSWTDEEINWNRRVCIKMENGKATNIKLFGPNPKH